MGGSPSNLFFPDNPHRRDRAQQLANDCQSAQYTYKQTRAQIAAALAPSRAKLQPVLKALGCVTLEDLDQKVLATATGDALAEWNRVRTAYDTADDVESVIWTTAGIVALAGVTISAVMGIFSVGIGFVAGMAITAEIELALGIIGAIYDLINGAIQRDKLRDAINKLFDNRLRINHSTFQAQVLLRTIPLINDWYDSLVEAGVIDKDRIIASFMRHKADFTEEDEWTYMKTAQTLHQMDSSRGSWTNEDPDWQNASSLDPPHTAAMIAGISQFFNSQAQFMARVGQAQAVAVAPVAAPAAMRTMGINPLNLQNRFTPSRRPLEPALHQSTYSISTDVTGAPAQTAKVGVIVTPVYPTKSTSVTFFQKPVDLHLNKAVSDHKAVATVWFVDGTQHQYIVDYISHQVLAQGKTQATAVFWSVLMPVQCLQPDGSFGSDAKAGQMLITSQ